jgi:hypothetical protein
MSCVMQRKKNFGPSNCPQFPQLPSGMITTPDDWSVPAATANDQALFLAYLQAAILDPASSRIYYWPDFDTFENASSEQQYEDGPLSILPTNDGNYRFRFGIAQSLCMHKAMFTHRANKGRVIILDKENQFNMTELADGSFAGFKIQLLHTEKLIINDGSVATKSPIFVALRNNKEWDKSGVIVTLDTLTELYRIMDVDVTVALITDAGDIDVDVKTECDQTPVSGLVTADFVYKNAAGVAVVITAATESSVTPGRYKLTQAGDLFVDGTVDLKAPDVLSIQAYESVGPATVNIP